MLSRMWHVYLSHSPLLVLPETLIPHSMADTASLIAQSHGATPELCSADSNFRTSFESCEECILDQLDNTSPDYLAELQPFIDYCNRLSSTSQATRATSQLLPLTSEALTTTSSTLIRGGSLAPSLTTSDLETTLMITSSM